MASNNYVRVITFDLSKAFDTVKHKCIIDKLACLPISDEMFNWYCDFLQGHTHRTYFNSNTSASRTINASLFQGSVVGPSIFMLNGADLKPLIPTNYLDKYADDMYLIVPSGNDDKINLELNNIQKWCSNNNMKLNCNKSKEIIFFNSHKSSKNLTVPPLPNIPRVETINILGVEIDGNFSVTKHVESLCNKLKCIKVYFRLESSSCMGLILMI